VCGSSRRWRCLHGVRRPFAVAWLLLWAVAAVHPPPAVAGEASIEFFTRGGCPRCVDAGRFLDTLAAQRPAVTIIRRHVDEDPAAIERLQALARERGGAAPAVPAFLVRGQLLVGFLGAESTGAELTALLDAPPRVPTTAWTEGSCSVEQEAACAPTNPGEGEAEPVVVLPLLGPLSSSQVGLTAFTIAVGLLDGFNPCAMWVLLFLLSLLVNLRDRTKLLLVAGTFVVMSGVVYFAFMATWLNVFLFIGISRAVQVGLGLLALGAGVVNTKDFFALRRGVSLSIPESARPGLYARMRRVLYAPSVGTAVVATSVLALLVNAIELLCTAGLPALYTQILTLHALPWWQYYAYLALYNVAYILDDTVMLGVTLVTLHHLKLQERAGRWLRLISGSVMLVLGALLLFRPSWLSG
jgi:hypothetical protein